MAKRLLGSATLRDVFIVHELYHHAEAISPGSDCPAPSADAVSNWQLAWRTGIAALAEIAAGAFAQSLLDLPYHPRVLDLVALGGISNSHHRQGYNCNRNT